MRSRIRVPGWSDCRGLAGYGRLPIFKHEVVVGGKLVVTCRDIVGHFCILLHGVHVPARVHPLTVAIDEHLRGSS